MRTDAPVLMAVHSARTGGAQLMALHAAAHLAGERELHLAVRRGPLYARFAEHGRTLRASPTMPFSWGTRERWALQLARSLVDAVRLAAYIRRHGIGVVYVNSLVLVGPVLAARLAGVCAIVHARELPATGLDRALTRMQARLATTVIAVSGPVRDSLGSPVRARVALLPDGAVIPETPPPAAAGFHSPLRLCLIGTIDGDGRKGQDIAIEALARLRQAGVPARLRLVGPISDPEAGRRLSGLASRLGVGGDVELTGPTDGVDEILADSDVLLSCARQEPLGLTVIEALARERPVVATRVGGVPGIVRDGVTGVLVEPEAPAAVADGVARLVSDPDAARAMARAGRREMSERFSLPTQLGALSEELVRALGDRRERDRAGAAATPSGEPGGERLEQERDVGPRRRAGDA